MASPRPATQVSAVICLMGPTGAGKTACAIELARRFPIEIISVDSALVYRGLDIGTAKPDPGLRREIPHHLIDVCDPAESYSAARFRRDASDLIGQIRARGRTPLLVGGTGLYFRALVSGISELPAADAPLRLRLQADLAKLGTKALHARLSAVDPQSAARIHPNDPQRILRALEIHDLTGQSMTAAIAAARPQPLAFPVVRWVVAPRDRTQLHQRLARRFDDMLERGLINEVCALRARADLDLNKSALRAVGYRAAWQYLSGSLTYSQMREAAIVATRQLAKRQYTWFRAEAGAHWWDSDDPSLVFSLIRALDAEPLKAIVDYT
ncbi:MAG: tRNA (adenosine(37)-N6)-dimethylallyltransferase MiaA [Gammaproteobacteria bacterium]|nr:tRNA (adenosine(37)-N6)-dimethylallyltransferase MiaA [Gammaproteobacteria bacterium]